MTSTDAIDAAIAQTDRGDIDRTYDNQRKTAQLMKWIGVKPGMHVVELVSAGGASAELLARIVGQSGKVYAVQPAGLLGLEPIKQAWEGRLAKFRPPQLVVMNDKNLTNIDGIADASVDLAYLFLNYHDMELLKVDRAAMHKEVRRILKPGGTYFIGDHASKDGRGCADCLSMHRVDEQYVKNEVTAAGFTLEASGDLLRNASDQKDWDPNPFAGDARMGSSDRFLLKFKK